MPRAGLGCAEASCGRRGGRQIGLASGRLGFSPSCAERGRALSRLTGDRRPLGCPRHPKTPEARPRCHQGQLLPPCGPRGCPSARFGETSATTHPLPSCCQGEPSGRAGPGAVMGAWVGREGRKEGRKGSAKGCSCRRPPREPGLTLLSPLPPRLVWGRTCRRPPVLPTPALLPASSSPPEPGQPLLASPTASPAAPLRTPGEAPAPLARPGPQPRSLPR